MLAAVLLEFLLKARDGRRREGEAEDLRGEQRGRGGSEQAECRDELFIELVSSQGCGGLLRGFRRDRGGGDLRLYAAEMQVKEPPDALIEISVSKAMSGAGHLDEE